MILKQKTTRDVSLDFVKGFCVVGMIIHHSLDYFTFESALKLYFRFITGSFIFIAGFIITSISLDKYKHSNKMVVRLITRGFKLLVIFTSINFVKSSLNQQSLTKNVIIDQFSEVFISGSYKIVAFELLIPIAYVLIFIGIIMLCFRNTRWVIITLAMLFFIHSSVSFFNMEDGYNFRYFTIGVLGAAFGFIPRKKLYLLHKHYLFVTSCYILYIIFMAFSRLNFPYYVLCVVCNLVFLYMIGSKLSSGNALTNTLLKFGNYTLISYLVQILILRVLVKLHSPLSYALSEAFIGFIVTLIGTYLCVELVNYMKVHSLFFSKLYRLVFA